MSTEAIYLELALGREAATATCIRQSLRAERERGSFIMRKREGFGGVPVGGPWHGEDGRGLPKSEASCVIGLGGIFGFLRLVLGLLSWKPTGLVSPASCGGSCESEFYCLRWFGHCLFVCSVSQWEIEGERGLISPDQN